jgi:ribonuclease inhibitor
MRTIYLDAGALNEKEAAHAYLKEQLDLPDYYGNNLDALFDCLTELSQVELVFTHVNQSEGYFDRVFPVFQDAAEENESLILTVEEE